MRKRKSLLVNIATIPLSDDHPVEQLMDLIDKLVKDKLDHGQFDECSITMNDIRLIKETIADILPSVNHARIKYKK